MFQSKRGYGRRRTGITRKKKEALAKMRRDAKGKRSVSILTMREIDGRIAKLTKSHNESMVRHQMIMNTITK